MDWHLLGVKLGIEAHELKTIEKNHHGDAKRCKNEMLDCWLRSAKFPTWKAVADALCQMEEHGVASKIRAKSSIATGMCPFVYIQLLFYATVEYFVTATFTKIKPLQMRGYSSCTVP